MKKYIKETNLTLHGNTFGRYHAALQTILSVTKGTKLYYQVLTSDDLKLKCCNKWEEKLNVVIDWKECFRKTQNIDEISLKWFQIRITHRIIATNIILKEIGVVGDALCSFCKNSRDSIEHMLWKCNVVQKFWKDFQTLINDKCTSAINFTISESLILFGVQKNFRSDKVLDFILVFAKKYVYSCKFNKTDPCILPFQKKLHWRYLIEEYNARIQLNAMEFQIRWCPYYPLFEVPEH